MDTNKPLIAFHGDSLLASATMSRVRKHIDSNQIKQGIYVTRNSGIIQHLSSMGALLYGSDSLVSESKLGIPVSLMELQESLFDLIEKDKCSQWPIWFIGVMRCGSDLRTVTSDFFIWFLSESETPVIEYVSHNQDRDAIIEAVEMHERRNEAKSWELEEGFTKIWEPKMRSLMAAAKSRGDNASYLALRCAFFSLYARFSVGGALSDGLSLYGATADGELVPNGKELMVSITAKQLLKLIGDK